MKKCKLLKQFLTFIFHEHQLFIIGINDYATIFFSKLCSLSRNLLQFAMQYAWPSITRSDIFAYFTVIRLNLIKTHFFIRLAFVSVIRTIAN